MKLIYLKSVLKYNSFDVAIGVKIQFFRFWLLLSRFVTTNCLIQAAQTFLNFAYRIHEKGGLGENLI